MMVLWLAIRNLIREGVISGHKHVQPILLDWLWKAVVTILCAWCHIKLGCNAYYSRSCSIVKLEGANMHAHAL